MAVPGLFTKAWLVLYSLGWRRLATRPWQMLDARPPGPNGRCRPSCPRECRTGTYHGLRKVVQGIRKIDLITGAHTVESTSETLRRSTGRADRHAHAWDDLPRSLHTRVVVLVLQGRCRSLFRWQAKWWCRRRTLLPPCSSVARRLCTSAWQERLAWALNAKAKVTHW